MATTYDELVRLCTNGSTEPYDYQRRIAAEGLPELLNIPTGAGKTMAVVLGWLYRRRFHPDLAVRAATPHWLVICQPMRTLVEQVRKNAETWLNAAGLADDVDPVNLFVFMGGEPTAENDWRLQVHQDAIIVGTQDMLLSRALNRGFGSSRFLWPVEFGVLNTGCHWVFDEVQLMGAGVPTGRQLAAIHPRIEAGEGQCIENAIGHGGIFVNVGDENFRRRGRVKSKTGGSVGAESAKTIDINRSAAAQGVAHERRDDFDGAGAISWHGPA